MKIYQPWLVWSLLLSTLLAACQPVAPSAPSGTTAAATEARPTLVLASHDSFNVSEEVLQTFEDEHHVTIQFLALGDAGEALNKMILSKDAPLADLFFGVDNTFLSRALRCRYLSALCRTGSGANPGRAQA
ncbi:MAG: hypothetical protein R2867_16425 [Caldilineaceae bacterium]